MYLPLVQSFARRYSRSADDYDDLYQVGCIGLIKAIDRFQVERGGELAAFAVPNIAGEIRRYLRDRGGSVRLPRRVVELRGAAVQAQRDLATTLGRAPTSAEIAKELGAKEEDVALALDAARASQAFELNPDAAGAMEPIDAVEDRVFLSEAFRGLEAEERRILYLRYVQDLSQAQAAQELGLSPKQLSRRTEAALGKLRHELERSRPRPRPEGAGPRPEPAPTTRRKVATEMARHGTIDERYLNQPYRIQLTQEPEGGWTARVEEFTGCVARGATRVEAVVRIEEAMREWVTDALARGRVVPKPRAEASHSGRLLVRMPQSLHAELSRAAEREEVSLNQFITGVLASAVDWRNEHAQASDRPKSGRPRGMAILLAANLVLVGLAAAAAIGFLIAAWLS